MGGHSRAWASQAFQAAHGTRCHARPAGSAAQHPFPLSVVQHTATQRWSEEQLTSSSQLKARLLLAVEPSGLRPDTASTMPMPAAEVAGWQNAVVRSQLRLLVLNPLARVHASEQSACGCAPVMAPTMQWVVDRGRP